MKRLTRSAARVGIAAAVLTLPTAGFAQEPQTQPAPTQQAAPTSEAAQSAQPTAPASQPTAMSEDAARTHLTAARNTLSQMTQLPAAAQLQGANRAQVAQLINNFNELITTPSDWKAAYAKVSGNLAALLATPAADEARPTGTAGAVGTSGTAALDPTIRAKLVELKTQLDQFEKAAGAPSEPAAAPSNTPSNTTSTTTSTTTTTTNPPTPTTTPAPTEPAAPATPAATTPDPASPASPANQELIRHIEAMEVILNANASAQAAAQSAAGGAVTTTTTPSGSTKTTVTSADVRLTPEQIAELKTHLTELRRLVQKN